MATRYTFRTGPPGQGYHWSKADELQHPHFSP
jgi:hypothetical protein